MRERATCPACGVRLPLTPTGRYPMHDHGYANRLTKRARAACPAAGYAPRELEGRTCWIAEQLKRLGLSSGKVGA